MQRQACKDTSSRRHYAEARSSYAQPFLAAHMTVSRELRHRARGKFFESVLHNESNTNSYLGMSRMKWMRHQSTCNRNFCPSPLRKFFENGLYNESNTKPYLGMSRMKRVRHQDTCNHNFCPSPLRKFFENVLYNESNTYSYLGMSRMKGMRHQNTCNRNFCPMRKQGAGRRPMWYL